MTCAVCSRQAKGFGWSDSRLPRGERDPAADRRVFCSMRCQSAFSRLMERTEGTMVDPSEMEKAAMRACLVPLGEYVGSIGMERALAQYTRDEALTLVEVVVSAYQDHMLAEHGRMAARDRAFLEERLARKGSPAGGRAPF